MTGISDRLTTALADRYGIERELDRGGMATVYLAHDLKHDRRVALKVLDSELAKTIGPERFQREIRLAARLQHPHILSVFDSGDMGTGQLWFTMPFVDGESLRDRLRREGQLPLDDALRIARETAQALEYAHEQGIVHRDIKPENLLLTKDGSTLVADFGVARALGASEALTQTGMAVGTPAYMSPEQAASERTLDARSDVYSLGAVLYEMLAGEPPHSAATVQALIAKLMTERPTRLRTMRDTVPEMVDAAVTKALAKVPATVYLAEDVRHRRKVAVKVLRPELAASMGPDRFLREIEIAAQLQHPHILPLLDSGDAGGFLFYVMPFVQGESLRDRLARASRTSIPGPAGLPAWSPDGRSVAFNGESGIRVIDVESDLQHLVVETQGEPGPTGPRTGERSITPSPIHSSVSRSEPFSRRGAWPGRWSTPMLRISSSTGTGSPCRTDGSTSRSASRRRTCG